MTSSTTPVHPSYDVGTRVIRDVVPMEVPVSIAQGTWSCTRCRRQHPVESSEAVVFESEGRLLRFVVCPACAEVYRVPGPVRLDLRRLPPADVASQPLKTVTAHAWFVSNVRARPPETILQLRDSDVRELALRNRETPTILVRRLARRGLLASA